ncbi:hypothetical protein GALL_439900 [mine drainage metagenome]|uniref:Uncharacterized protein n=1 Tax=mine drainage metagenome TaxID=410659 RepID=A0A1J5Q2Y7_9ZZZZ
MDVARLKAFVAIPGVCRLAFAPECPVALRDAVEVALDRIDEAACTGLHQKACAHLDSICLHQATIPQPLDNLAVARGFADCALGCGRPGLGTHSLHISIERGGTACAGCRGVFLLIGIGVVLVVRIGRLRLLQAVYHAGQLIQKSSVAVELQVESVLDPGVGAFLQAADECLYFGNLHRQRAKHRRQCAIGRPRQNVLQASAEIQDFGRFGFVELGCGIMQLLHIGLALPCVEIVKPLDGALKCCLAQAGQSVFQDKGAAARSRSEDAECVAGQLTSIVLPRSDAQIRGGNTFARKCLLEVLLEQFRGREHQPAVCVRNALG